MMESLRMYNGRDDNIVPFLILPIEDGEGPLYFSLFFWLFNDVLRIIGNPYILYVQRS
jgi:hypothetical protein